MAKKCKATAAMVVAITLSLSSLLPVDTTEAQIRAKQILKIRGRKERFSEPQTGGAGLTIFQPSRNGAQVAIQSNYEVSDNKGRPQLRFLSSAAGKPSLLVEKGKVSLESGQEVSLDRFTKFRLSPDGSKVVIAGYDEPDGQCSTCAFVIDTSTGKATELSYAELFPSTPNNISAPEVFGLEFGSSAQNLYITTRHTEYGGFPDFTPKSYSSIVRYDTSKKTAELLYRDGIGHTLDVHYITDNEAFALAHGYLGDKNYVLYRINLATGVATTLFSKPNLEEVQGLWLSDDGETAFIRTDYKGKTKWYPKLLRIVGGNEKVLSCKDTRRRYSSDLNYPVVSRDGRFATFFATFNGSEGQQGPMNKEVGVLNLSTGACAFLGESSRFLSNEESAVSGDGNRVFFVQRLRKPGSDQTIETTLFSTSTAGIFRKGVRSK